MEQKYENLLNISTSGVQKNFNEFIHYNRYEPTSYYVLEALREEFPLCENDYVVDYGCGKGRLNFFMNHFFNCHVTGIEMNNYYYDEALDNLKSYSKKHKKINDKITFINSIAENYEVQTCDNKFYFFNPFSVKIFISVVMNIELSTFEKDRTVDIILYYPSDDYIYFLENHSLFELYREIKLHPHYDKDDRERILVYRLGK